MAYPESGATYRHTPKFIDRMHAAEGESPKPYRHEPHMTAGAESGVGRLEKAEMQRHGDMED